MSTTTEFTSGEIVTATMTLPLFANGEHFGKPLSFGYYNESDEIWIDGDHGRQNIPAQHVEAVIRQLRRACRLAKGVNG